MKAAGQLLCALLVFIAASAALAVILAFACGGLSKNLALASLAGGILAGLAGGFAAKSEDRPPRFWDWLMLGIFALVSLRAFLWLVYVNGDEIRILSPNNLGDLSLHINFIRYLAGGVPFWPESPILSGVPLSYPLGTDLFNALFETCGADTFRALVWVGLLSAALTGWALWRWGGAFGLAAFLFNGGLAGFSTFRTGQIDDFQKELVWKNLFLSMFVTQRGLLFAIPAGLVLLTAWRDRFFRENRNVPAAWVQWLLYAAMPLFNLHAFLFLSAVLGVIFLARPSSRKPLLALAGAAFVPAALLVVLVTGQFSANTNTRWLPGWILEMDKGQWLILVLDFGIMPLLAAALAVLLIVRKPLSAQLVEARCFVGTAVAIFVFSCLVALAPWPWDNMKLMMWSWLVLAPYLWTELLAKLPVPARAALCFLLFFSGAVSLAGGLDRRHGYGLARRSELDAWASATKDIPRTKRFACTPDYNHPLILLGRKVACGYDGHLFSHGLDYHAKWDALHKAIRGEISWTEVAPELQVQWLAIRKQEMDEKDAAADRFGLLVNLKPQANPTAPIKPIPVDLTPRAGKP